REPVLPDPAPELEVLSRRGTRAAHDALAALPAPERRGGGVAGRAPAALQLQPALSRRDRGDRRAPSAAAPAPAPRPAALAAGLPALRSLAAPRAQPRARERRAPAFARDGARESGDRRSHRESRGARAEPGRCAAREPDSVHDEGRGARKELPLGRHVPDAARPRSA